ncbi:MAG: hypothetical protein SGPRY_009010 [Prymnesium sp.]
MLSQGNSKVLACLDQNVRLPESVDGTSERGVAEGQVLDCGFEQPSNQLQRMTGMPLQPTNVAAWARRVLRAQRHARFLDPWREEMEEHAAEGGGQARCPLQYFFDECGRKLWEHQ